MKYFICEGIANGKYNASSKARMDAENILLQNGYNKLFVNTINGVQNNKLMKWKQYYSYKKNNSKWNECLSTLKKGDIVLIQYPILNTTLNLEKTINKFKNKGIIFATLIHDMDSLRYKPDVQGKMLYKRVVKEDKYLLNEFNYIIAHNNQMRKELIKLGNDSNNIITLNLFDYLVDRFKKINRKINQPIVIAGNLSHEKAEYIYELNKINLDFNLFGVGYEEQKHKNIHYKGKYLPEELINYLEGSFGLVWDGITINTCTGGFGEYLKYNNPHKASLYLTAGLPIIVWKDSALSEFVNKNKVGLVINDLNDLKNIIENISEKEYNDMLNNVSKISNKTKNGMFLTGALSKIK